MKCLSLLLFLLFLGACSQKRVRVKEGPLGIDAIQLKVTKETLNNGLTVILVENRKLPLFSFFTFVKVGARHETPGITGASHYLEHMMFKGSSKYRAGEFEKTIIGNGGSHNAYTTRDLTVYHESLPIAALDKVLDLEADRIFSLSLEKDSFERERSVILEERKFRTENSPRGKLWLRMMKAAYKGTPYAHPPIGFVSDIKTISREHIRQYFETFYDPANIVIVLSGDFSTRPWIKKIRAKFGQIPSRGRFLQNKKERDQNDHYNFQAKWNRNIKVYGHSPVPLFMVSFPSFPKGHQKSFAMEILSGILGGGKSSYFLQKYVYGHRPVLGSFYAFNHNLQKSGLLILGGQLLNGKNLISFRRTLRRDLKNLCKKAISDREVEKIKNQYLVESFDRFETNRGLAQLVGESEVNYGNPLYFKEELKSYLQVTSDEVREVCLTVVEKSSPIIVSVWDKHKKR